MENKENKNQVSDELNGNADDNMTAATENNTENETGNNDEENQQSPIELLKAQYDELNDSYLRLHAEFDNYRKRTIKEKADIIKSGGERILSEIIVLVDDFERALASIHTAESKEAVLEGIDLIYAKFGSFLSQQGVKEIEAIGQDFDAEKFEAVTTVAVEKPDMSGKVVDCIQKGYSLNGKTIRYPKVIVGE